jgi:hypothetical protein
VAIADTIARFVPAMVLQPSPWVQIISERAIMNARMVEVHVQHRFQAGDPLLIFDL